MVVESKNGHRIRVRKKIDKSGLTGMAEYEILEYMLFGLFTVKDTKGIAKRLLKKFKNIENLLQASKKEVLEVEEVGEAIYIHLKFTKELTEYLYQKEFESGNILNSVEKVYKHLKSDIGFLEKEVFKIIFLNSKNEYLHDKFTKHTPIEFDENNVCYACKTVEKKWDGTIDWKEREKELIELCKKYKNFKGPYIV